QLATARERRLAARRNVRVLGKEKAVEPAFLDRASEVGWWDRVAGRKHRDAETRLLACECHRAVPPVVTSRDERRALAGAPYPIPDLEIAPSPGDRSHLGLAHRRRDRRAHRTRRGRASRDDRRPRQSAPRADRVRERRRPTLVAGRRQTEAHDPPRAPRERR